ncbi:hypothetical protein SNEBB_007159 [Seison nebaliae]|nr:hypothetical protein SNEBB_007159 [Seison nebaliae]
MIDLDHIVIYEFLVNMREIYLKIIKKSVVNCEVPLRSTEGIVDMHYEQFPPSSMSFELTMAEVEQIKYINY